MSRAGKKQYSVYRYFFTGAGARADGYRAEFSVHQASRPKNLEKIVIDDVALL